MINVHSHFIASLMGNAQKLLSWEAEPKLASEAGFEIPPAVLLEYSFLLPQMSVSRS